MNKTLEHYNNNISAFTTETVNADVSNLQNLFLKRLSNKAYILDLGCGSGRDSKAFIEKGHKVIAVDGSIECCKYASELIGQEVLCKKFDELDYSNEFDGIWACASLLHIPYIELASIFDILAKALKKNGVLYCSFKYGDFEGERNGRYFTDLTEESFGKLIKTISKLQIVEIFMTNDARKDRDNEKWLNCIIKKSEKKPK